MMSNPPPKMGLALGAGGIRACAHIGVLKVLVEEGIPIHCLAGASAGALIGLGFAGGMTPQDIEDTFLELRLRDYLRFYLDRLRLCRSNGVARKVLDLSGDRRLEELPIACALVALDLQRKERVVIREGPVVEAIAAAIAIPFVSGPARMGGRRLYDGGLIDPLPLDLPRSLGAQVVIAVDVGMPFPRAALALLGRLLRTRPALREAGHLLELLGGPLPSFHTVSPDLLLNPDLRGIGTNSIRRSSMRRAIAQGETCTRASLPAIRALASGAPTAIHH